MFWFVTNPTRFFNDLVGINQDAFQSVIPWIVAVLIALGYIIYTAKAVPFVQKHLVTLKP